MKEIIPHFFLIFMILSSVVALSQLLRLSEQLFSFGLSLENFILPIIYILVPFIPIFTPIAFLFSSTIAFSRLHEDGEIDALQANGYSLWKLVFPVTLLSVVLCFFCVLSSQHLESWGRRSYIQFVIEKTQTTLDHMIQNNLKSGVFMNNFLNHNFYAENISEDRKTFKKVVLAPVDSSQKDYFILAKETELKGKIASGQLILKLKDGLILNHKIKEGNSSTVRFEEIEIDLVQAFHQQIFGEEINQNDFRNLTHSNLTTLIRKLEKKTQNASKEETSLYQSAGYLYYSRHANPFILFSFALLVPIIVINNRRKTKNFTYFFTILIIILTFSLSASFRWLAEIAFLSPILAAWAPILLMTTFSFLLIHYKNSSAMKQEKKFRLLFSKG